MPTTKDILDIKSFTCLFDLLEAFPNEDSCIEYLERLRWNGNVVSPYDSLSKVYVLPNHRYFCKNTQKQFNVKVGTLFENTKLPLRKWFIAIWLVLSNKKGISSLQLSRDLQVTQKTAWYMLQRIRECMNNDKNNKLKGEVEADETYVGGKEKYKHEDKKVKGAKGRSTKTKTPVFGMVKRSGDVIAAVVNSASSKDLVPHILKHIGLSSILYTDEWIAYRKTDKKYTHLTVNHSKKEFVRGKVHTNTIENFWSIFKRGIIGIYHQLSVKHLQKYVNEFAYRRNSRKISEFCRFNLFFQNIEHRLTYKKLIYG